MADLVHFVCIYVTWAAIPCLAIIGIVFGIKQRTKESQILSSGIILIAVGSMFQVFSPFSRMKIDVTGKILSSSGPPLSWYTGSIISTLGLIATVVGFALVTRRSKGIR